MSSANPTERTDAPTYPAAGAEGIYGKNQPGDTGAALGTGQNRDPVYQPVTIPQAQLHEYGRGHNLTHTAGRDDGMPMKLQADQMAPRAGAPGDREFGSQPGVGGMGQPQTQMGGQIMGDRNVNSYDQTEFGEQAGATRTSAQMGDPAYISQDQNRRGAGDYQDDLFGTQRGVAGQPAQGPQPHVGTTDMPSSGVAQSGYPSTTTGHHHHEGEHQAGYDRDHGHHEHERRHEHDQEHRQEHDQEHRHEHEHKHEHEATQGRDPAEKEGKRLERSGKVDKIIGTLLGSSSLKERGAEKQAEGAAQKEQARGEAGTTEYGPGQNTHAATGTRSGEDVPVAGAEKY